MISRPSLSRNTQQGFSLIEVCIAMLILAMVLTPLYTFLEQQKRQNTEMKEDQTNNQILSALAQYVKENGAFPCPADRALPQSNSNFGVASCTVSNYNNAGGKPILYGDVPVRTLGLPYQIAANRQGWKYIYAVSQSATVAGGYNQPGAISIKSGGAVNPTPVQFVLVNLGNDGRGAFTLNGVAGALTCGAAPATLESPNCYDVAGGTNNGGVFVEEKYTVNSDPSNVNNFDDNLFYTLASKDSTFWLAQRDATAGASGELNITNRNLGNIGIGTTTPSEKLHVVGGNVHVETSGTTGGNITADQDVNSTNVKADDTVTAGQKMSAPTFYYCTAGVDCN